MIKLIGYQIMNVCGRLRSHKDLTIAIAVFFLRRRRRSISRIFGQQFTSEGIDLPRLGAIDVPLHALNQSTFTNVTGTPVLSDISATGHPNR